ncbi:MAG: hypothetical protein JXB36_20985 [Gammaproteobacteria bacterium]|nr:hypothetical protein [Gammaproteobacteria bacterium]
MFEVYAFLAMFTAQIAVLTVLHPAKLIGCVRAQLARHPAEKLAELYPGGSGRIERQLKLYRLLNGAIALVGAVLLGWFFSYMQRPDWTDGPVETLVGLFFMLQLIPVLLFMWIAERTNKRLRSLFREETRTAVLERRRLFDFVSPFVVVVTLLCYPLFVAFVAYLQRDPFPGFKGYFNVGVVTVLYAVTAAGVYSILYGRKVNPLQTHADRMHKMEVTVKVCIYSCLAAVAFLSLNFALAAFDLQRWEPLAQSAFLVICAILYLNGVHMLPSGANPDRLRSRPV